MQGKMSVQQLHGPPTKDQEQKQNKQNKKKKGESPRKFLQVARVNVVKPVVKANRFPLFSGSSFIASVRATFHQD